MGFKSMKVLITTIGLNLSSAAIAEDLVKYATNGSGTDFYYDADTIRTYSNNTVELWDTADASKDKTVTYRTQKVKLRLNCSAETYGTLYIVNYRANGTVMYSESFQDPEMKLFPPSSSIDILFKILCLG